MSLIICNRTKNSIKYKYEKHTKYAWCLTPKSNRQHGQYSGGECQSRKDRKYIQCCTATNK